MRALLFLLLSIFLTWSSLAQEGPVFSPIQSVEFALESFSDVEKKELKAVIFQEIRNLRKTEAFKNKIPVFTRSFKTIKNLPLSWQKEITKALIYNISKRTELDLVTMQASKLFSTYFNDSEMKQFYQHKLQEDFPKTHPIIELLKGDFSKEEIIALNRQSNKVQDFYLNQAVLNEVEVNDGFEVIDQQMNLGKEELTSHIERALDYHSQLEAESLKQLHQIDENSEHSLEEIKKYIDRGNLNISEDSATGSKAEKTFIFDNNKESATLITKVVLNDSENAYIIVPKGVDLNSKHFKEYVMRQHRIAGNSERGFKDVKTLQENKSNSDLLSCMIDHHCYQTQHSKQRLDRSKEYWKASFRKKYVTRGRNLYIITVGENNSVSKVMFSPRAKVFDPQWWKSGKALKELKVIFYKKPESLDWVTGALFGSLNAAAAYTFSSASTTESIILASTAFAFSTFITAHNDMFQAAFKSWKPTTNIVANFIGTYLPFVLTYSVLSTAMGYDQATLNFLSQVPEVAAIAKQNLYNIFSIGFYAKVASEYWKGFVDSISAAKLVTGRFKDLNLKLNWLGKKINLKLKGPDRFTYVYQGWHLIRSTFKNVAVEKAFVGGSFVVPFLALSIPNLELGNGFVLIGAAHYALTASLVIGAIATQVGGRLLGVHKKSEKARQILKNSIPLRKMAIRANEKIIKPVIQALKCQLNYIK